MNNVDTKSLEKINESHKAIYGSEFGKEASNVITTRYTGNDESLFFGGSKYFNEDLLYGDPKNGKEQRDKVALSIHIDPADSQEKGYINDPYIKIYDSHIRRKANHDIRIKLMTGECEHHDDVDGPNLPDLYIGSSEGKMLNKIMKRPCDNPKYPTLTVEQAIKKYIFDLAVNRGLTTKYKGEIPDFTTVKNTDQAIKNSKK